MSGNSACKYVYVKYQYTQLMSIPIAAMQNFCSHVFPFNTFVIRRNGRNDRATRKQTATTQTTMNMHTSASSKRKSVSIVLTMSTLLRGQHLQRLSVLLREAL